MKKFFLSSLLMTLAVLMVNACGPATKAPQVEGHYTYQHSFNYEMDGNHFDVHETGTMDFYADSSALDSARQVYTVLLAEGDTVAWVFNYISPSRWHQDGEYLYFAGVKDGFRMELVEGEEATELAEKIVNSYIGGIEYEYKFHIDTLTDEHLQWSFTYRDGHSDTWQFNKTNNGD